MIRIALFAFLSLAVVQPARACSCACTQPTGGRDWESGAEYVVRGTVVSAGAAEPGAKMGNGDEVYVIRPSKYLKGKPAETLTLLSPPSGGSCGVGWTKGETRDVLAIRSDDGKLRVHLCAQVCAGQAGVFKKLDAGQ